MDKPVGLGQANGKIILIGEHAVVYHQPSIAIPFPATQVNVTITPSEQDTMIDCAFYTGLLNDMPELLESLKKTIELSLANTHQDKTSLSIKIDSTIPAERGMGSSAAVSVALTRAIFHYFNQPLGQDTLLSIVHQAETIAHGNPSGLDALMTSSTQPYYFIKGEEPKAIPLNLDAVLVVADTGMTGQTKKVVQAIADKVSGPNQKTYQDALYKIGLLTNQANIALSHNHPTELGKILTAAQQQLVFLGASNQILDHLVAISLENGALGAKLTGGGSGGCMIALAPSMKTAITIQHALEKNGAKQTWLYEMSDLKK